MSEFVGKRTAAGVRASSKEEARLRAEKVRLSTCPGCKGLLEPVVFFDENPAPDNHDNGDGSRPALAIWGWCGCATLKPEDPPGWWRASREELAPEAWLYLEQMNPPVIVTCRRCKTRVFPVLMYEPGTRVKWIPIGEVCLCSRKAMDEYRAAGGNTAYRAMVECAEQAVAARQSGPVAVAAVADVAVASLGSPEEVREPAPRALSVLERMEELQGGNP